MLVSTPGCCSRAVLCTSQPILFVPNLNTLNACRPPTFDVHQVRLEATYKALQRRLHPDKYSTASPVSTLPPLHMLNCKVQCITTRLCTSSPCSCMPLRPGRSPLFDVKMTPNRDDICRRRRRSRRTSQRSSAQRTPRCGSRSSAPSTW